MHWHSRFLTIGATRYRARNVITWNLALDGSRSYDLPAGAVATFVLD